MLVLIQILILIFPSASRPLPVCKIHPRSRISSLIVLLRGAPLVARIVHFNVALRRHRVRQFHFLDSDLLIF